jgi:hypothetical protein
MNEMNDEKVKTSNDLVNIKFYTGLILNITAALLFIFIGGDGIVSPATILGILGIGLIATSKKRLL